MEHHAASWHSTAGACVAVAAASLISIAHATDMTKPLTVQDRATPVQTVDELKRVYIACDKASERGLLAHWQIAQCSVIYEELKRRAFGGDFDQFHAWSRTRR